MIFKRTAAHILNRIIILVPAMLLLRGESFLINPSYFIFGKGGQSGWLIFWLFKYLACLPLVFLDLIRQPLEIVKIVEIILPALLCLITIDVFSIRLIRGDLRMRIMGLKLESLKDSLLSLVQILTRTFIKYLLLAFFPLVLVYIFLNKENTVLYDRVSSTKIIKT